MKLISSFSKREIKMLENEGYRFMGAAFEVCNELGYGMAEEIYQQSLEIELSLRGIPFQSKRELNDYYKEQVLDTRYKPDLIVFEAIVVELKAVSDLAQDHEAQLFNYMRIARKPIGYLLNFGKRGELEWKRFIVSDLHERQNSRQTVHRPLSFH